MTAETQGGIPLRLKEPSVKLPKAVQLQVENAKRLSDARAAEIKEALTEKFNQETPSGAQNTQSEVKTVEVTPQKTEAAPAPTVTPEVKSEDTRDAKYWEHRFKTNNGIQEAEKQRLKNHITTLESRLSNLENQLKTVQTPPERPAEIDIKRYVSPEEIETYGKEMLSTVGRTVQTIAKETTDRRLNEEITKQVTPIKQQLEETQSKLLVAQQERFWEDVNHKVPNWVTINDDARFHDWLAGVDPFTGINRQILLTAAQQALDANRVVAMFTAFSQTTPAPNRPSPEKVLEKVVPDPIGQTAMATSTTPEVVTIRKSEISKFYKDKAIGRYKYRQQEAEQMEKKIQAAVRSGNVLPG